MTLGEKSVAAGIGRALVLNPVGQARTGWHLMGLTLPVNWILRCG